MLLQAGFSVDGPSFLFIPFFVMNKADIVDHIARATGLTKIETEAVIDGFVVTVVDELKEGGRIELRGFGTFEVRHRKARVGRNPRTNEEVRIAERYAPYFKPSREFARRVDEAVKDEGTNA